MWATVIRHLHDFGIKVLLLSYLGGTIVPASCHDAGDLIEKLVALSESLRSDLLVGQPLHGAPIILPDTFAAILAKPLT